MTLRLLATSAILLLLLQPASRADEAREPTVPIMELMVAVVAPMTDTLWGIEDPQSDAEWQVFIDAANTIIDAGRTMKVGGTGPNDNEWAADPAWQAFADQLIGAAEDARAAAENQDVEAMYTAGEVIYPPCEECHLQFNPGVTGEQ
jgi:cytochrome c556